jgi:hypothetical protein
VDTTVSVGTLVYVDGNWHKVIGTSGDDTQYLISSFYWWVSDRWINAEKVENTMVDTGQFD